MKTTIGIIGGGYTAGELLRLLVGHPHVEIACVQSRSQAGKPITSVHEDLAGECDLAFSADPDMGVDVLFLCSGHGQSRQWMAEHRPPAQTLVIDLSTDYRMDDAFVYGLPELNRAAIANTRRVANPGCFATAIQLGLLPLAAAGALNAEVNINAITGSTGAGQAPSATTHYSWRSGNISVYKPFEHQHLAEIGRSLTQLQPGGIPDLAFLPVRGNFTRGIFATLYCHTDRDAAQLQALYRDYYAAHPFTHVVVDNPNLKQVVNTNKALVHVAKHGPRVLIISVIDNLLKGASGQAVQNMNIAIGCDETAGLRLKGVGF